MFNSPRRILAARLSWGGIVSFAVVCGWLAAPARGRAAEAEKTKAYIVIDDKTGHVLAGEETDKKLQVASLTKIATAMVVFDWARLSGQTLDQPVPISPAALTAAGGVSPIGFQAGDAVTLRDLLYSALLQSDNVAAEALAAYVGAQLPPGPVEGGGPPATPTVRFVAQMNALARNQGMERTRFLNPTGQDSTERPFSTVADLAKLTRYALTKADFRFFVAQKERRISISRNALPSDYLLRNTNELLGINRVDGVKTGQTQRAGSCLIITAAREPLVQQEGERTVLTPRRLIVVVLGSPDRFRDAARLLNQGIGLYDQWASQGYPIDPKKEKP